MSRFTLAVLAAALAACQCFAATPVAAVSSNQPIVVSGITVPTNRLISWPLSVNDEITTQSAPAMVRFSDGTVVTLQRNSHMRLDAGKSGVEVKMLSGSAVYDIKANSNVAIHNDAISSNTATSAKNTRTVAPAPFPMRGTAASNAQVVTAMAQAPSSGLALAPADIKSAVFSSAPRARTLPTQGSDQIFIGSTTILETHLVSGGGNTGQPSVLVIDRVIFKVADPSRPGEFVYLSPPKGFVNPLIGSSLTVPAGLTPLVNVNLTATLLNGTPLTPAQVTDLLQQAANAAFNDPNNFFLPGQAPPAPIITGPVTIGTLSGKST